MDKVLDKYLAHEQFITQILKSFLMIEKSDEIEPDCYVIWCDFSKVTGNVDHAFKKAFTTGDGSAPNDELIDLVSEMFIDEIIENSEVMSKIDGRFAGSKDAQAKPE